MVQEIDIDMSIESAIICLSSDQYFDLFDFFVHIIIIGASSTQANVITPLKAVQCECYTNTQENSTHTNTQDKCEDNTVMCTNSEDRDGACFVLWQTNNVTGT